jgi:hypothetical protein
VPESTRGRVSIGSFFSGVVIIAPMWKELLLSDPCTEKIYKGDADVEAVLRFKNPIHASVKASAKTLSSYFIVFAYIAYNLAQS